MKKYFFTLGMIGMITFNLFADGFRNPVIPGFYPDPSVCRVGDDYYLVTSSFEYFPGVPVFHSKDMINWEQVGHCLTRDTQVDLSKCNFSAGIYAPTIRYHNGTFYMVTTNVSGGGNFYVTTTDPEGEWSEPIWVKQGGIDPTLFWDDDGTCYFMSNGGDEGGIAISKIDIKTGKLLTPPVTVWKGEGGRFPEAPHIYKKDGFYYLLIAEGGTEYAHSVTIARSNNLFGPYEGSPSNPILTHSKRSAQNSPIQGVGHADLIQAHDNSWWAVFLGFRPIQQYHHNLGRETFLAPVSWPKNGWPVINGDAPITLEMDCPTLPLHPVPPLPVRDDFNQEQLALQWNYLRNPIKQNYSLTDKEGTLTLLGSSVTLDENDSPTFVGRRQQHIQFEATTPIDFTPKNPNEIAGITAYMNPQHHYDLYIEKGTKSRNIVLRYKLGKINHIEKKIPVKNSKIQLRITGNWNDYQFSYSEDGKTFKEIASVNTYFISKETAGGFTGVYIGLYATGQGKKSQAKARFDWFDYEGKD